MDQRATIGWNLGGVLGTPSTGIGSAPTPDTVSSRLQGAFDLLMDCHKAVNEIESVLGLAVPADAKGEGIGPGVNGMTMAVRSSAMDMRERLQRILSGLR